MSAANAQLKELADRLTKEDAELLVLIGRRLDSQRRTSVPLEDVSPEEASEIQRRLDDPDDKPIPFDQACHELGI
jgi:hypothetical protein